MIKAGLVKAARKMKDLAPKKPIIDRHHKASDVAVGQNELQRIPDPAEGIGGA